MVFGWWVEYEHLCGLYTIVLCYVNMYDTGVTWITRYTQTGMIDDTQKIRERQREREVQRVYVLLCVRLRNTQRGWGSEA